MKNATTKMGFDELLDLGEVDLLIAKVQDVCAIKLRNKVIPGMEHDDVVQEVSLKVFKAMESYDNTTAKASTYFDNVIANMIKDCYKKAMSHKNLSVCNAYEYSEVTNEESDEPSNSIVVGSVDYDYENAEFMIDLMNNMGLTEREKEIFTLRCDGYEFKEIAEIYGVSKPRMTQIWSKIKAKYENM